MRADMADDLLMDLIAGDADNLDEWLGIAERGDIEDVLRSALRRSDSVTGLATRLEMLQAQCRDARAALTAAGVGEGETLADGISELSSRIADLAEAERRGVLKAVQHLLAYPSAGFREWNNAHDVLDELRSEMGRVESGETP
jgi:hypothetical protein